MAKIREPVASGRFYVKDESELRQQVEGCFTHDIGPGRVPTVGDSASMIDMVTPHAGLPFSGPVAAHAYDRLASAGRPATVVIIGPNHTGVGANVALPENDAWRTPLGTVEVDTDLREDLLDRTDAVVDGSAHAGEHAAEVQLPFLQFLYDDFTILPISLRRQTADISHRLGDALAAHSTEDTAILASSDFTHYEPHEVALEHDRLALDQIEATDPDGLIETVNRENLTVCGYGAIASLLVANPDPDVDILAHATSGDTGGSKDSVVGYAAIALE